MGRGGGDGVAVLGAVGGMGGAVADGAGSVEVNAPKRVAGADGRGVEQGREEKSGGAGDRAVEVSRRHGQEWRGCGGSAIYLFGGKRSRCGGAGGWFRRGGQGRFLLRKGAGLGRDGGMMRMFFLMLFCAWAGVCFGQVDEFSDGDDDGWTRMDPIGELTGSPYAVYQLQSGLYRMSCAPSPDAQLGPARVASYRADAVYGKFVVVVDVVSWNAGLDQSFGILTRLQGTPGPGAVDGYSLNYQPADTDLEINRLEGEAPTNLARVELNLAPGGSYRFVFTGDAESLGGAVYDLEEPLKPLAVLGALDGTFASGYCGLFGFDTTGTGAVDVTFDSYAAGPGTAPELEFVVGAGGDFRLSWPRLTGRWHLETSAGLDLWEDVLLDGGVTSGKLRYAAPMLGRRFYRLAEGWGGE
ncbi:MAG: hypothetical protein JWL81_1698 [Verrucomicrobiales bacterium]|nr:hypothetical protein [Verrucomicrobiales bacterium]